MAIDVETLAAARTYTDDSLKGVGSVQGKNCTIQEITKEGTTNTVTFAWTDDEGNVSTSEMIVEDGKDGETGPKGDPGEKGETGATGETGASAYELALENGFEGSEEDWLKSLTPTNIVTVSNSPFESHAGTFKINEIGGKSEQFTTTGKNLLNVTLGYSATKDGVTCTIDNNGIVTLNGTATADAIFITHEILNTIANKQYSLELLYIGGSVDKGSSNNPPSVANQDGSNGWQGYNVILKNSNVVHSYKHSIDLNMKEAHGIYVYVGNVFNNFKFRLMFLQTDSTVFDDVYEPYTGGQPSPNPDYPQEVKKTVISEIKTHGKNLLDINKEPYLADHLVNRTYGFYPSENCDVYRIDKPKLGNIYFKMGMTQLNTSVGFYSSDNTLLYAKAYENLNSFFINHTVSADYLLVTVIKGDETFMVSYEDIPYEPYTESTITLSQPVELYGIGDVQDTIEDGKVVRRFGNRMFDGSEDEAWYATERYFISNTIQGVKHPIYGSNGLRNALANVGLVLYSVLDSGGYGFTFAYGARISLENLNTANNTLEELKTYLAEHPIAFLYELAEPVIEELPLPDQAALNSLSTFNELTYVEFDSEIEPTFQGESALTIEGSHILDALAKSNVLAIEYLDAATYICDNLP